MNEIEELIAAYTAALPKRLEDFKKCVDRSIVALRNEKKADWDEIEYQAHKLAGSSGTYGFIELWSVFRHVEEAVADGRLKKLSPVRAAEHLERAWNEITELAKLAQERKPTGGNPENAVAGLARHLEALIEQGKVKDEAA